MLGLVVALPVECGTLYRGKASVGQTLSLSPDLLLRVSGIGSQRAVATAMALHRDGARAILSWGCSAALTPGLRAGELLLPERFITVAGETITPHHNWWLSLLQCLGKNFRPATVPLAGTDRLLATPQDKRLLNESTGAAAADMETASLASWAQEHDVPFVAIRSVSDGVDTVLPKAIQVATDDQGDIDTLKLFHHILRHPGQIPDLIQLARQFRCAHRRLAHVARIIEPTMFCLPC